MQHSVMADTLEYIFKSTTLYFHWQLNHCVVFLFLAQYCMQYYSTHAVPLLVWFIFWALDFSLCAIMLRQEKVLCRRCCGKTCDETTCHSYSELGTWLQVTCLLVELAARGSILGVVTICEDEKYSSAVAVARPVMRQPVIVTLSLEREYMWLVLLVELAARSSILGVVTIREDEKYSSAVAVARPVMRQPVIVTLSLERECMWLVCLWS